MTTFLDANPQYTAALHIAKTLRTAGHQAFFAGGCVRDLLLNISPKDFDVATSATPEIVQSLFPKTHAVGAHFGVVLVLSSHDDVETTTEVATFRDDGAYTDGRRPDAVRFSTDPREDVLRRDFTINGMLLGPVAYEATRDAATATLDFVHGREDLAAKIVRAIGDPSLRFTEDKLRMLRAVRFAARLDFEIEAATMTAIRAQAAAIHQVSAERIRDELTKMLTEGHARRAFELLDASGLLAEILPEVVKMHNVQQPPEFHPEGDVWVHTLLLLEQLPPHPSATLAWGALLHDIGKPATFRAPDPGRPGDRIRFNGHVEVGVRIAEVILNRLRFSNEDTAQIVALVQNHMRFGDILQMKQSTLKRFLRLPKFEEHLALHWLDCSSCHNDLTLYNYAKQQFEAAPEEHLRPQLLLTGRELIAAGYPPSPQFKPMLEAAEDAQLEGLITTTEDALALIQERFGPPPPAASFATPKRNRTAAQYDTLIIGAGMAGLSVARALAASGQRVLVLEARDRIGGRILTKHLHNETIELGAEFVHGRPPELWALIEEAGLTSYERDGSRLCFEDNALTACREDGEDGREGASTLLEDLEHLDGSDLSFADYLDRKQVPADQRPRIISRIEGFNAADHHLISAASLGRQQQAEDATEGDRIFSLQGGYAPLIDYLAARITAAGGAIQLSTPVRAIHWHPGHVEAITDNGTFTATRAVITLPLGVLQANTVSITPAPGDILALAGRLRMGQVCRFNLIFSEPFWTASAADLSFLFAVDAMPPVWWTQHPSNSNTLIGWIGGPRSAALAALSSDALADHALATLSQIFSLSEAHLRTLLLACETHDWQSDPYALGAYSYIATGSLDVPEQMTRPIAHTLYFAGEHTDTTGHWGTVHAALRSGLRAAQQILES